MAIDWNPLLLDQLTWHWDNHVRPRLDGLTDDEYLWEPVAGCWSVRRRGQESTPMAAGGGDWVIDWQYPEPVPAPVTTIAWRLGHVTVGVFGMRTAAHFGGPPLDYATIDWAPDAARAIARLDDAYGRWVDGVRGLGEEGLARPCGDAEGPYAAYPLAALVLHIHREAIHHLAEVLTLRDLYRSR